MNEHLAQVLAHLNTHDPGDPGILALEGVYAHMTTSLEETLSTYSGGLKGVRINRGGDVTYSLHKKLEEALDWRRELDELESEDVIDATFMTEEEYMRPVKNTPLSLFDMAVLQAEVLLRRPDTDYRCFASNWE